MSFFQGIVKRFLADDGSPGGVDQDSMWLHECKFVCPDKCFGFRVQGKMYRNDIRLTQKGIFVIESKNYSGWIFGDEKAAYWTAMLPNKEKNRFYNPVWQNRTHIKWLEKYLDDEIPFFSIVAFSERCELKKAVIESADVHVIKREQLYAVVRNIWDNSADKLDEVKVNAIYEKLKILTNTDQAVKAAHIENINRKYKKTESPDSLKIPEPAGPYEDTLICPRCGERLVLRVAKKGANAGKNFYGCSNYPKCRYIQNID